MNKELRGYFQRVHEEASRNEDGVVMASTLAFDPDHGLYFLNSNLGGEDTVIVPEFHEMLLEEYGPLLDRSSIQNLKDYFGVLKPSYTTNGKLYNANILLYLSPWNAKPLQKVALINEIITLRNGKYVSSTWREQGGYA